MRSGTRRTPDEWRKAIRLALSLSLFAVAALAGLFGMEYTASAWCLDGCGTEPSFAWLSHGLGLIVLAALAETAGLVLLRMQRRRTLVSIAMAFVFLLAVATGSFLYGTNHLHSRATVLILALITPLVLYSAGCWAGLSAGD